MSVLRSFIASIPTHQPRLKAQNSVVAPHVHIVPVIGLDPLRSEHIDAAVLDSVIPAQGYHRLPAWLSLCESDQDIEARPRLHVPLVLYNISLSHELQHDAGAVDRAKQSRLQLDLSKESGMPDVNEWNVVNAERQTMIEVASVWLQHGIKIVASQKVIHPFLKDYLLHRGVLPLERLSARHLSTVQHVSGARILSSLSLSDGQLSCPGCASASSGHPYGFVSGVYLRQVGDKRFLVLHPMDHSAVESKLAAPAACSPALQPAIARRAPVSTLLLCALERNSSAELCETVQSAFSVLKQMITTSSVVPGRGAFELQLADELRAAAVRLRLCFARPAGLVHDGGADSSTDTHAAPSLQRRMRTCVDAIARCFDEFAVAVSGHLLTSSTSPESVVGVPFSDLLDLLRTELATPRYTVEQPVLDCTGIKERAIEVAFQAAMTLLRVNRVVVQQ